jgi:hypothetical protein
MTENRYITPGTGAYEVAGQQVGLRMSPLFEALLNSARHLLRLPQPQPTAAVLIAQTAIEVCTERIITRWLHSRGATYLYKWVDDQLVNYNVYHSHVKALYKAVTEDRPSQINSFGPRASQGARGIAERHCS